IARKRIAGAPPNYWPNGAVCSACSGASPPLAAIKPPAISWRITACKPGALAYYISGKEIDAGESCRGGSGVDGGRGRLRRPRPSLTPAYRASNGQRRATQASPPYTTQPPPLQNSQ